MLAINYYYYLQYCVKCAEELSGSTEPVLLRLLLLRLSPCPNSKELSASSGRCCAQHSAPALGSEEEQSEPVFWTDGEAGGRWVTEVGGCPARRASGWVLLHQAETLAYSSSYSSPVGGAHVMRWDRVSVSITIQTRILQRVVIMPGNRCKPGLSPASGECSHPKGGDKCIASCWRPSFNTMDDWREVVVLKISL